MSKTVVTMFAAAVVAVATSSASAEPKVNFIHQWNSGNVAEAIGVFGAMLEERGVTWENQPVPGWTTETYAKVRADILAGQAPAISQLKGKEIAAWSTIGPTLDLSEILETAGFDKVVPPVLVPLHKPADHWLAIPMQIYRINNLLASKKALDRAGIDRLPTTWAEFNEAAEKLLAVGIRPLGNGGLPYEETMILEVVLLGKSVDVYQRAFMDLDESAYTEPVFLESLEQLRKMLAWRADGVQGQYWATFVGPMMQGEYGFMINGGWVEGSFVLNGSKYGEDYLCGIAPIDDGGPARFDINVDGAVFWKQNDPDYEAGQKIAAEVMISPEFQLAFSKANRSIPSRIDIDVTQEDYTPCQRETWESLNASVEADTVVLSLAQNMAQRQQVSQPIIEAVTEFVNNPDISVEEAAQSIRDAVAANK